MSTNDLWTALLSDDPEELNEALEAIAADDVSAEISRREVFGGDPADSPEAVAATWDDADTWYGAAPERRAGARVGTSRDGRGW